MKAALIGFGKLAVNPVVAEIDGHPPSEISHKMRLGQPLGEDMINTVLTLFPTVLHRKLLIVKQKYEHFSHV